MDSDIQEHSIASVVSDGLCTGCGACISVCAADAIRMVEKPWGALFASVDPERCTGCGLCSRVCPGSHLEAGLLPREGDPFKGSVMGTFLCQATDEDLLSGAQSGGVASTVLLHLLDEGEIDQAVVTQMPEGRELRPRTVITSDLGEILAARGSKYCPVPADAALSQNTGERIALVGLSCHVHGLRNAQEHEQHQNVVLTVGLVCEGTLAYGQIDHLVRMSGLPAEDVTRFRYKSKKWDGWPGDVLVATADGREQRVDRRYRMGSKDAFALPRCRLCFDKLNVLSDVALGDAWGLSEDKAGVSVAIARSPAGLRALKAVEQAGRLRLTPVAPDEVFDTCQQIEARREVWTAYTRIAQESGRPTPDLGIGHRWCATVDEEDLKEFRAKWEWCTRRENFGSREKAQRVAERQLFVERVLRALNPAHMVKKAQRLANRTVHSVIDLFPVRRSSARKRKGES